ESSSFAPALALLPSITDDLGAFGIARSQGLQPPCGRHRLLRPTRRHELQHEISQRWGVPWRDFERLEGKRVEGWILCRLREYASDQVEPVDPTQGWRLRKNAICGSVFSGAKQ